MGNGCHSGEKENKSDHMSRHVKPEPGRGRVAVFIAVLSKEGPGVS
jgi:hypothetical protein